MEFFLEKSTRRFFRWGGNLPVFKIRLEIFFSMIKKNKGVPYGSVIEELFINPATDIGYQKDPNYLLKNTTPDGKSAYYGMNRQGNFPVSISIVQLEQAFQNAQAFQRFY